MLSTLATHPLLPWLAPLLAAVFGGLMALKATDNKVRLAYGFVAVACTWAWLANGWLSSGGPGFVSQIAAMLSAVVLIALGVQRFALKKADTWLSAGMQTGLGFVLLGITYWMEAAVTGVAASGPLATPITKLGIVIMLVSLAGIFHSARAGFRKAKDAKAKAATAPDATAGKPVPTTKK